MRYFIITNDIQQGPFSLDELRQQAITSETLVWTEGMAQWLPAWQVEELRPLLYGQDRPQGPPMPPPPPLDDPAETDRHTVADATRLADEHLQTTSAQQHAEAKKPHRGLWAFIILAGLLLFMGITNPSPDEHRAVIRNHLARGLSKALADDRGDMLAQGMEMMARMMAAPIVDAVVSNMLEYHNYQFFSTTTIETREGTTTTSYGLFGKVFTVGEEKIASVVSSAMRGSIGRQPTDTYGLSSDAASSDDGNRDTDTNGQTGDTTSLQRRIGHAIIDHLGQQLKKQVHENADSTDAQSVDKVVDDVMRIIKSL